MAPGAIFTGMTSSDQVWHDVANNIKVLSLLVSMIMGIEFIKQLLPFMFTASCRISVPHRAITGFWTARGHFHFF
ncbi:hypothetical protein [Dickeya solani]|uniref:hypothetical protein n=2 Tax=Dickeya solani TaxID=1089444 RepID=UPI001CC2FC6C